MQHNEIQSIPTISDDTYAGGSGIVQTLLAEHQQIKALLEELTEATDAASCEPTLEQLKTILTVHNASEETCVYPALSVAGGEAIEPRKLYFETAEADQMLFNLSAMAKGLKPQDGFQREAKKFSAAIREHIDSEENHAFKHLEEKLDERERRAVELVFSEFRSKIRFGSYDGTSALGGSVQSGSPMTDAAAAI